MDLPNFWNFNPSLQVYNVAHPQYQQRGKYKRSTNNSHKKFISVARKLLFKICSQKERSYFEKEFETYKNSRTFYFIILAHVKIRMNKDDGRRFTTAFVLALNRKIQIYNNQIRNTHNSNFIHFRFEEISDIQFAIKAMELYFDDKVQEAIETVYRKDRLTLFKRQQYDAAVKTIFQLQKRLKSFAPGPLFPYFLQDQKNMQHVSRKIPNQLLRQFPSASENRRSRRKKSSDEEWMVEADDSSEPRKRSKTKKRRFQEKMSKNQNFQHPLLSLQNSFPIFPDFYKILFNYEMTNNLAIDAGVQYPSKNNFAPNLEGSIKPSYPEQLFKMNNISRVSAQFSPFSSIFKNQKETPYLNESFISKNGQALDFGSRIRSICEEKLKPVIPSHQGLKVEEAYESFS